jgi:DNA phosphorothioation-dependent restriction protein DptG
LEDIIAPSFGLERVLDIEVTQGNQCSTSPPIQIRPFQTNATVDWECNIIISDAAPLHFTLKIREIAKESTLKRSQSTRLGFKDGIKSITKLFGKTNSVEQVEEPTMIHCASFSSISSSGFKRENVKSLGQQTHKVKTGQFNVINIKDWLSYLQSGIEQTTISFFQNDWDRPKKSLFQKAQGLVILGKANMQALFLDTETRVRFKHLIESL